MDFVANPSPDTKIPREVIRKLLSRIYSDPHFAVSVILKRFLSFVVEETLAGRSGQLGEYVITANVFSKLPGIGTDEDTMVRIYASRIRRALFQYYNGAGANETIRIDIPHGTYVPVFKDAAELWMDEPHLISHKIR